MATDYRAVARAAATRHGIDAGLFERQIQQESGFRTGVSSGAGAQGIAQIMPATARGWGVDPNDPDAALNAAAKAMSKYVKSYGSYKNALIAYNAGPGRVGKPLYKETADYIQRIMGGKGEPAKAAPGVPAAVPSVAAKPLGLTRTPASQGYLAGLFDKDENKNTVEAQLARSRSRREAALAASQAEINAAQPTQAAATPTAAPTKGGPIVNGDATYKEILKFGQEKFGLRIDGNNQTTGGKHEAGSNHYVGRAVDFGDAKNDPAKLRALAAWAKANRGRVKEFYYDPLGWHIKNGKVIKGSIGGHGDHVHIAM